MSVVFRKKNWRIGSQVKTNFQRPTPGTALERETSLDQKIREKLIFSNIRFYFCKMKKIGVRNAVVFGQKSHILFPKSFRSPELCRI